MYEIASVIPLKRPKLKPAKFGHITQGSLFCCATAQRYRDSRVYGVVITARCDLAQNKCPVLNYLPVVSLADWMREDGLDILMENKKASIRGSLRTELKKAGLSENLLDAIPLPEIASKNFPREGGDRSKRKAAERFHNTVHLAQEIEELVRDKDRQKIFGWFVDNTPSEIDAIVSRLSKNQVSGHYMLESIDERCLNLKAYVCLLREVYTIPKHVGDHIGRGLSEERLKQLSENGHESLDFRFDDLAMPVVEIDSPTIEHLLQSFTNLFARIGVADPDPEVISRISEYAKFGEGT